MEKLQLKDLTYIKAKAIASGIQEIDLSSDDLILCGEIIAQRRALTLFDALHASVALNNKLTIISNDEAYDEIGVERISFKEFLDLLEKQ